jgi:hypothetical protein
MEHRAWVVSIPAAWAVAASIRWAADLVEVSMVAWVAAVVSTAVVGAGDTGNSRRPNRKIPVTGSAASRTSGDFYFLPRLRKRRRAARTPKPAESLGSVIRASVCGGLKKRRAGLSLAAMKKVPNTNRIRDVE